ncbi:MAG: S8 family serine peptidase [Gammaproteobacteria bacterium]
MNDTTKDNTSYYYSNGQRIPLVRDPEAYAVRFRGGEKSDSTSLSGEARTLLRRNSEHLGFVPNHNLQIYRLVQPPAEPAKPATPPPGTGSGLPGAPPRSGAARTPGPPVPPARVAATADARSTQQLFRRLEAEPVIDFAAPVYRRGASGDMMLVTRQFVAQFKPAVTRAQIDELNSRYGVKIVSALDYAHNGFILEAPTADGPTGPVALGNLYYESGLTEFAQPDLITKHYWRTTTLVPEHAYAAVAERVPRFEPETARDERNVYQSQQWHLTSANIIDAWSITRGRSDIKVCILDDGVDVGHGEFATKVVAQFDFFNNTSDARPKGTHDNHGTACAGVATAAGAKALGAAPGCSLIAACTPAWGASTDEARMFKWAADQGADVISCSWGPTDGTGAVDPLPDATRAAIRYCVTQGRGGKGCSVLFAAGNGNESVSNDGYAANPDVMAIAASTDGDTRAWYSDFGPEVSICAPSNGGSQSILTADRRGANGYNKTHPGQDVPSDPSQNDPFPDLDYTSTFGGTSSSTPLVAGVVGLMLSANPDLTPAQVRQCLQNTATKIGPPTSYTNGHSPQFGYGKVNAGAAVREAQRLIGTPTTTGTPTITAVQQTVQRSGPAPSFRVDPRPNTHYAIEIAARPELLDAESGQPANEYYASWEDTPFMNAPIYTLPQAAWDRVKDNAQLFYRAWTTASPPTWVNTLSTTGDGGGAAAQAIQIAGTPQSTTGPTMTGPPSVARSGAPPTFTVNPGPNTHYAVEFAARPELLDAESGQAASEYYASWEDSPFMSASTYQMPGPVWDRLKGNARLFYRAWTTSNANDWVDTQATAATGAEASSFEITGAGAGTGARTVTFPSGLTLNVVDSDSQGGVDYSDPEFAGVPLLNVTGRGNDRLSTSFLVSELAGRNAKLARIDVALVEALQQIRDRVGAAVTVVSGYRHPAQDAQANGLSGNRHVSGQGAEIRASGRTARDLARLALETLGCQIGIGLGANSIDIDVRGSLATWVLSGAAMTAGQFEQFVNDTCAGVDRSDRSASDGGFGARCGGSSGTTPASDRTEASGRGAVDEKPEITGPETANIAGPAPEFRVSPGRNSYYAVEVAVNPSYLDGRRGRDDLPPTEFYGSWEDGLQHVEGLSTTYILPQRVWEQIGPAALRGGRLYYRVITTSAPDPAWPDMQSSLPDGEFSTAPGVDVWLRPGRNPLGPNLRPEEVLWRQRTA